MTLNNTRVEEQCPIVADILTSQITKFITLVENDCGCIGTTEKLIFNCVHSLFHKAKVTAIREENPNCFEATTGLFDDEYLEDMKLEILTLESMGACAEVDQEYDMNIIQPTWEFKCKWYPYG